MPGTSVLKDTMNCSFFVMELLWDFYLFIFLHFTFSFRYTVHWLDIYKVYETILNCSLSLLALHLAIILLWTAFPMLCSPFQ